MFFRSGKTTYHAHRYALSPDELAAERAAQFNQPRPVQRELFIAKVSMAVCIPLFSFLMCVSVPVSIVTALGLMSLSFCALYGRVSLKASLVPALSSLAGLLLGYFLFVPLVSLISDFIREYYCHAPL